MGKKEAMLYSFENVIRYSEIDPEEKLSVFGLINYFQDCSNFQSADLNVGVDELIAAERGWLLSYWQIDIHDMPKFGQKVTAGTWAYEFERFMGRRNFVMLDENNNVLACADSLWVFMDTKTGKPAKAEGRFVDAYELEPRFEGMEYEPRKIKCADEWEEREEIVVRRYHLDTNNHVNNARYIQFAQEFLPEGFKPKMIRAEYKLSALLGDTIHAFSGRTENGRIQVDLRNDAGKTYALVEFAD
ncbi:MAG: acyl-[acyl-carrier-protein] thioesterase [Bacteroides sp.]